MKTCKLFFFCFLLLNTQDVFNNVDDGLIHFKLFRSFFIILFCLLKNNVKQTVERDTHWHNDAAIFVCFVFA